MSAAVSAVADVVFDLFGHGVIERFTAGDDGLDVVRAADSPTVGLTSWATVGAHRLGSDTDATADDRPPRTELLGAVDSRAAGFGAVLAETAFSLQDAGVPVGPGAVLLDVVARHLPGTTVPHALLVPPVSWPEPVGPVEAPDVVVEFLQVVPVADAELEFLRVHGLAELIATFAAARLEVDDLLRSPVVAGA